MVALAVLLLAANSCSGDPTARWADIDRIFVQQMIPHHHLGMSLVDDATLHASDVRLRRLVFEMSGYHGTELRTLERWAAAESVQPAAQFPGSLTDAELSRLAQLDGPEHDIWWLTLMIRHHRGAVQIAESTLASSDIDDVRQLATTVREVQSREISEMEHLLESLSAESHPPASVNAGAGRTVAAFSGRRHDRAS